MFFYSIILIMYIRQSFSLKFRLIVTRSSVKKNEKRHSAIDNCQFCISFIFFRKIDQNSVEFSYFPIFIFHINDQYRKN